MPIKKTNEEFLREVEALVGNEYIPLTPYISSKKHVQMKHTVCGNVWGVQPAHFLNSNSRCKKCFRENLSISQSKDHEQFVTELQKKRNGEFKVLEIYQNNKTKILVRHLACGHEWKVVPKSILRGSNCPNCSRGHSFVSIGLDSNGREVEGKVCKVCNEWQPLTVFGQLLGGIGGRKSACKKCSCKTERIVRVEITKDSWPKKVEELSQGSYEACSDYQNKHTKVWIKHTEDCGHKFQTTPKNFLRGHRCPKCNESAGEREVGKYLSSKNIPFKKEFTFCDCKHERPLPFDFAVFSDETYKEVKFLIEYDGIQHSEPVKRFGGLDYFQKIQHRDAIKNAYCQQNNIPLLRIKYTQFDQIEEILERELAKYQLVNV
ncbi:DUF2726 domain-containing protein [Cytobacillus sp. FJAT-54145]|uniref:DUF2726 domain-containing protein n=1 Tax=Cytobacillus spartinae TaxID=3299023 RepID=A0ABW6KDI8_9BACI